MEVFEWLSLEEILVFWKYVLRGFHCCCVCMYACMHVCVCVSVCVHMCVSFEGSTVNFFIFVFIECSFCFVFSLSVPGVFRGFC